MDPVPSWKFVPEPQAKSSVEWTRGPPVSGRDVWAAESSGWSLAERRSAGVRPWRSSTAEDAPAERRAPATPRWPKWYDRWSAVQPLSPSCEGGEG